MTKCPDLNQWDFPPWLVCVCKSYEGFDEARQLLIDKYRFVNSPFELEDKPNRTLVLPIPGVSLYEVIKSAEEGGHFGGWGIGRARFEKPEWNRGGPSFEFMYFPECPWEYIQLNPMKDAIVELGKILNPFKFMNYGAEEISPPY